MATNVQLVCLDDFEARARELLPDFAWKYYSSGADNEETLRENRLAFRRLWLKPRVLRDVSIRDMSTTILGEKIDAPICISPTACHGLALPDGEIATTKAAADVNTLMVLSMYSSKSLEEVADTRPTSKRWFQMFICKTREVTKDMVKRAETAGFKALVVSVDSAGRGFVRSVEQMNGRDIMSNLSFGNLEKYIPNIKAIGPDSSCTWKDLEWLKNLTDLPIVLKGILTVEDAMLAAEYNVQGIIVSNHGGRQLDCLPATIDVLPDIVKAVGGKLEVYMDSGIRTGTDVLKALALGARAVFIGRPVVYGLACKGEEGVKEILTILRNELSRAMALTGCARLSDITEELIIRRGGWSK